MGEIQLHFQIPEEMPWCDNRWRYNSRRMETTAACARKVSHSLAVINVVQIRANLYYAPFEATREHIPGWTLRINDISSLAIQGAASPCEHGWVGLFLWVAFSLWADITNATHTKKPTKPCSQGDAGPCTVVERAELMLSRLRNMTERGGHFSG